MDGANQGKDQRQLQHAVPEAWNIKGTFERRLVNSKLSRLPSETVNAQP